MPCRPVAARRRGRRSRAATACEAGLRQRRAEQRLDSSAWPRWRSQRGAEVEDCRGNDGSGRIAQAVGEQRSFTGGGRVADPATGSLRRLLERVTRPPLLPYPCRRQIRHQHPPSSFCSCRGGPPPASQAGPRPVGSEHREKHGPPSLAAQWCRELAGRLRRRPHSYRPRRVCQRCAHTVPWELAPPPPEQARATAPASATEGGSARATALVCRSLAAGRRSTWRGGG
jgi:hypothetical protein